MVLPLIEFLTQKLSRLRGGGQKVPSPAAASHKRFEEFHARPLKPEIYYDENGTKIRVLSKQNGALICQLDDNLVRKFGDRVFPAEATAMILVQEHTEIPVPKFEDFDYDMPSKTGCLWMSFLPGTPLDLVWKQLQDDAIKLRICQDIWTMLAKIRSVPRPPKLRQFFQYAADGSPSNDVLIQAREDISTAPLLSENDLNTRIIQRYTYYHGTMQPEELLKLLPRSTGSVFTHADIATRNVMVDESYHIIGLIDWENSGWYPFYWEYANIMRPAGRCGDWQEWMERSAPQNFKCNLEGINAARKVLF